jgi:hypothetical protein
MPASSSAAALSPLTITGLTATALCSSGALLAWQCGDAPERFEIERRPEFGDDRQWRAVGAVPGTARRYESVGLLGAAGRSWSHRVRAVTGSVAGAWAECAPVSLPVSPGGPRGALLVSASASAPRNISGSFVKLANGDLLFSWTASANLEDNAPSWLPAIALTPAGVWEDRDLLFPMHDEWTCVSRPSLVRMRDGGILATYSVGRAKVEGAHDGASSHFLHRTVARISRDEARTWSEERVISDGIYDYEMGNSNGMRNLLLSNGRLLTNVHVCKPSALAAYDPFGGKDIFNEVMGTYLLLSDDDGRSWQRVPARADEFFFTADDPYGRRRIGFWEIAVIEHAPGQLLMHARNASGWLYETRSTDYGSTWSTPVRSSIPYPIAPPNLTLIPGTGTIVLLSNPHVTYDSHFSGGPRDVLALQLSDDGGRTWHGYRELEYDGATADPFWSKYSYPDFAWDGDDLHIIYSRKFTHLYHQKVTKRELLANR